MEYILHLKSTTVELCYKNDIGTLSSIGKARLKIMRRVFAIPPPHYDTAS
jgi:hypothetical protein